MHGSIKTKDIEVSDDYLVLDAICEDHDLPPKALASMVGRAKATIYRYLNGEATIPSFVWRVLYEKTRDVRITSLITGAVKVVVVDLLPDCGPGDPRVPEIKSLIQMRGRQIKAEEKMLNILADGKIDEQDATEILRLKKDFRRMLNTQSQIYYAIERCYERSLR